MGLLAYKVQDDQFRVTDPNCRLREDQVVHRAGQTPLVIDVTFSNVITPDIKEKKEGNLQLILKCRAGKCQKQRSIKSYVTRWTCIFYR